jgi:putative ABC transport system permease protein
VSMEVFRYAGVRVALGQRHRQVVLEGLDPDGAHRRIVDRHARQVHVPSEGIVLSSKLAEVLGAKLGDLIRVEALEGRRRTVEVPLAGLSEDFAGIIARMDRRSVNRLMGEGDWITGASFFLDATKRSDFLNALKQTPRASWVAIKESLRANFRQTTAASIKLIQSIYLTFAIVVTFGVVYNNTRISLAERAREFATLRVIGFSQREVGSVLVIELIVISLLAVPMGLLLGTAFATGIIRSVNTETIRLPLILTLQNYTFAVCVVVVASIVSAILVLRTLHQLDLVGALKAPE